MYLTVGEVGRHALQPVVLVLSSVSEHATRQTIVEKAVVDTEAKLKSVFQSHVKVK
jgi:hypothetical protein